MILNENKLFIDYQRIKQPQEKMCAYFGAHNTQYSSVLAWAW